MALNLLHLLNRGLRPVQLPGSHSLTADIHNLQDVGTALRDLTFDVVVDWIAYAPDDIERDLALYRGRVKQFVFISSASAYQKPPANYLIASAAVSGYNPVSVVFQSDPALRATHPL